MATSSEFVVRSAMLTVKRRMGMQRYKTFWAAILIGGLVGGGEFGAMAAVGPATEAVRKTVDEVIRILEDPEWKKPEKKEERRKMLEQTIAQRFNFLEMSRRSLGAEWNKRTPEEQKDFAASFQTLLANTYLGRIETYSGGEKVQYLKEIVDGEYADVYTKLDNGRPRWTSCIRWRWRRGTGAYMMWSWKAPASSRTTANSSKESSARIRLPS